MGKTLSEIAQELKNSTKKIQLIYGFNGTGKTRLSREFKELIVPKNEDDSEEQENISRSKILYYNDSTEDLFYWSNDLTDNTGPKLKIQPNFFTDWILAEQGKNDNISDNFKNYIKTGFTPSFIEKNKIIIKNGRRYSTRTYPEVVFLNKQSEDRNNIKISKGEESIFIWSVFYTCIQEVISILDERNKKSISTDKDKHEDFDQLEYVFIDDPVSSLDENHLIQLAVDLAYSIKKSTYIDSKGLKFIITTHNPLFYNVLWNEFNNDLYEKSITVNSGKHIYKRGQAEKYIFKKNPDDSFQLENSNDHPFSYHLFLLSEIIDSINANQIKKYHFNFLRNILEKTATFLGYGHWEKLLEKNEKNDDRLVLFAKRIINLSSHSAHAGEEVSYITNGDIEKFKNLVDLLIKTYNFQNTNQNR